MHESDQILKLAGHHHDPERCQYYWKQKNSPNLIATIGDSFTKGSGLEPWEWRDLYGVQLADKQNCDWINAGCGGGSNSWSLNFLDNLVNFLNDSRYHQGTVILTLTENGRDIMEGKSRVFDYRGSYAHLSVDKDLLERVLDDIELEWASRILDIRARLDKRFRILIGNNFAWHETLHDSLRDQENIKVLEHNWLTLLPGTVDVPMIRSTILSQCMEELLSIIGSNITDAYKKWILDQSQDISQLYKSMTDRKIFFCDHDPGHPNVHGHRIWSEYLSRFF